MSDDIHRQLGAHDARLTSLEREHAAMWVKLDGMDKKLDQIVEKFAGGLGGGRMVLLIGSGVVGFATIAGVVIAMVELFVKR